MDLFGVLQDAYPTLLKGLATTVEVTVISLLIATVLGIITCLFRISHIPPLRWLAKFYIWLIRGTPLLVQLYLVFYGLPSAGIVLDAFPAAVLVFGFNEGAYMAESIRGALESVSYGQMEAGYCVGLNYVQIMAHAALSNSLISMLKGTSLAATITVMEMFRQAQVINGRVYESLGLYSEVAIIYLAFCSILTWLQHIGERKLATYGGGARK